MVCHEGTKKLALSALAFAALLLGVFIAAPARAQVSGGTFSGTVSDSSGAVIPNVQISIKDLSTGIVRTATTDAAGFFTAPNLIPATYEVSASAAGFTTAVQSGIALEVGGQQVLNFTMQVGQVSEKVQVTTAAPAVQLASSSIGGEVNSTSIRELPLNGRDWTSLATLNAGATSVSQVQIGIAQDGGNQRSFRGFGNQVAIAGARPQQNNYRIDGISINDYTNGGPGSVSGQALGVDAIQEFNVLTSNYTAEYGKTSGGVINALSRTGTNQFHGNLFEFLRNKSLDAANFFTNFSNSTAPPFRRNQFGGSAGGPIKKDRTFIFGSYEGFRQALGLPGLAATFSPNARNGLLDDGAGGTTPVTIDPLVKPFLGLWGPAIPGTISGDTGLYAFSASEVTSENFYSARVDHKISDKDSLFGSWQFDKGVLSLPDNLNTVLNSIATARQVIVLEETHIFSPTLVNSVRGGYSRSAVVAPFASSALNPLAADPALGTIPGHSAPAIAIGGLGGQFNGGVFGLGFASWYYNSFQAYDDAFLTKGKHSIKVGFAFERQQCNCYNISAFNARWKFGSIASFFANKPKSVNGQIPGGFAERGWRDSLFGAYIQDDIRWKSNLTINLGLRYETIQMPTEVHNKISVLRNPFVDAAPTTGAPIFNNPTHFNFEPRIGFAWDPFKNGKTSVRGSFGMFDMEPMQYEYQNILDAAAPFEVQASAPKSALVQGSFPTGAWTAAAVSSLFRVPYIEQNPHRSYNMTWNLNLQRELVPSLSLTVAYVGSRGVHLPFRADDMNTVIPTLTSAGYLYPNPIGSGTEFNPNFGRIENMTWSNSVTYHGLQTQLTKKMTHGFQMGAGFTWAKTIDFGSSSTIGDNYQSSISTLMWYDTRLRRGLADYNIGRAFTANGTWQVPTPSSFHGPAAWLARGWQTGVILTIQTGLPFTPNLAGAGTGAGGDPLGINSADTFDYPDRLSGPGCNSLTTGNINAWIKTSCFGLPMATPAIAANCVPFAGSGAGIPGTCQNLLGNSGRNIINGPGLTNLDFSLSKNNYIPRISETFNVQFRAEFFNVLNHPNFIPPLDNSNIFDETGQGVSNVGLIDGTATDGREIQFAIKIVW